MNMKKRYLSPEIMTMDVETTDFMDIISDGDGHYHQDIDPDDDPDNDGNARSKPIGVWDTEL